MCLLLFNWYGYRFVINYLQQKAERQLDSRIDVRDYDESQLVEIKVPLSMPYQNNQSSFERHYGEIEIGGTLYSYVERKIQDGYLVLKCIPNQAKQDLKTADNILFTQNNGLDQEHNGKNNSPLASLFKSIFTDYDNYSLRDYLTSPVDARGQMMPAGDSPLQNASLPFAGQPPELCTLL